MKQIIGSMARNFYNLTTRRKPIAPSGQGFLSTVGTDINAHAAGSDPGDLVPQVGAILLTTVGVEASLTRLLRVEGTPGESSLWTGLDAELTIAAAVGEGTACFQRGIGQDRGPAHAGPYLGGD